jgi:hypothetical protein
MASLLLPLDSAVAGSVFLRLLGMVGLLQVVSKHLDEGRFF